MGCNFLNTTTDFKSFTQTKYIRECIYVIEITCNSYSFNYLNIAPSHLFK